MLLVAGRRTASRATGDCNALAVRFCWLLMICVICDLFGVSCLRFDGSFVLDFVVRSDVDDVKPCAGKTYRSVEMCASKCNAGRGARRSGAYNMLICTYVLP